MPAPLSITSSDVLVAVGKLQPVRMRDLAAELGVSLATAQKVVRPLVASGELLRKAKGGPLIIGRTGPNVVGGLIAVRVDRETGKIIDAQLVRRQS